VFDEVDLAARASRAAGRFQRAVGARAASEARAARPRRGGADLDGVPGGAGDRAGVQIDLEIVLAQATLDNLALRDRGEHVDITLGELRSDRPVALRGVAQHPLRAPRSGLGVDEMLGLRTVGLTRRRDLDGRDQRLGRVRRRR
jgi:hypothetical protein